MSWVMSNEAPAQPWLLGLAARRARRIGRAPQAVIDEALGRLMALRDR
jgi:hypothetical protein